MSSFVSATEKMTIKTILTILSVLLFILITVQTAHSNDSKDLSQTEVSNASFSDLERGSMLTHTDRYKENFGKLYLASRGRRKSYKCVKKNCRGGFSNCDQSRCQGTCTGRKPICCCKEGTGGNNEPYCAKKKKGCRHGFEQCPPQSSECGKCKKKQICCCKEGDGGGGGGGGGSSPEKVGLTSHNNYRQTHKAPPMQLDSGLNSDAMRYAKKLAQKGSLEHDKTTDEGENLGYQCRPGSDAELVEAVVDSWYDEVRKYNFNKPGFSSATGHFTQVVWKASTKLGIGFERGRNDCLFVVGRYINRLETLGPAMITPKMYCRVEKLNNC